MGCCARIGVTCAALLVLRAQTPPLSDDVLLLSKIRRTTLSSQTSVPFYTCLETIDRRTRLSARHAFKLEDIVQLEVGEFGQRELFAWPGQTSFEDKQGQLLGLSSYGEFYGHLQTVMGGSAAVHYAGQEDCHGRPCARYDFELGAPFTHWTLQTANGRGTVAESGSFWADPETAAIYRLFLRAQEIPAILGIRSTELDIHYGATNLISSRAMPNSFFFSQRNVFQLPQNFRLHLLMDSGEERVNDVSFTQCREYRAESKVVAEASKEVTPEPLVEQMTLPAHLAIKVVLLTGIKSDENRVGDLVEAIVDQDVRDKKRVLVPRGAKVIGRVRRMEHYTEPYEYWIAALEFTDVFLTLDGQSSHARFTGTLESYDNVFGVKQEIETETTDRISYGEGPLFGGVQRIKSEKLVARQLPGVGTFLAKSHSLSLNKGFHMTWVTRSFEK